MSKISYSQCRCTLLGLAFAATLCLSASASAQQSVTSGKYMITLKNVAKSLKTGELTFLQLRLMDSQSMAPLSGVAMDASLVMPAMPSMNLAKPKVERGKEPGTYQLTVTFPHGGEYRLDLKLKDASGEETRVSMSITPGEPGMEGMQHSGGMEMRGAHGDWPMNREGSGTSWQPDSSPMYMKMLPNSGRYELSVMGTVQGGFVDAGGKRGERQGYVNSMVMLMGRRETGGGTLAFSVMASLDPITNGKRGVPNLFQTGETFNGEPLVDRQHPHDLFAEAALCYSHPIGRDTRAFIYGGPIGEPALGNVMFMHRPSGMEIPEAPISHHWFDSSHISFGVATAGLTFGDKLKVEGSIFNGHEPDENRLDIDPIQLNSASGRVSYNPNRDWSFSASYGYLKSPEELEPGLDQHRLTASANYNKAFSNGDNWATSLLYGKLVIPGRKDSHAFALESTYSTGANSFFGRFERVDKDELHGVPEGSYTVNKMLLGGVRNISSRGGFDLGIGGYVGLYSFPSSLKPYYGNPLTFGLFLRLRPSKM